MPATTTSVVYSTQVTHIGSGASLAVGGVSVAADVSTALAGDGNLARYPRADFALFIAPTASIASTSTAIYLYRRDLNIDGTNDETVPGASNKNKLTGLFICAAATTVSTSHYLQAADVPLPGGDCEFYIENGLGVNIPLGWTLKVTPKSDAFA